MKQKSLISLVGLILFLSVGCSVTTSLQSQPKVESSQSTTSQSQFQSQSQSQSSEYDKKKVEDCLMTYFNSLNKNNLDEYNSIVLKDYKMQRTDWDALQNVLVGIKNIEINFSNVTISDETVKIPVKYTQIMKNDFIPTNINPGENNITTDFLLKKSEQGKYYIADFSSAY